MKNFALLWGKILDSSIWLESKETRLVWITMLAMKDADGIVRARIPNLAYRARVEPQEAEEAVRVLSSPDPSTPDDPEGGVRIKKVEDGWLIVNHEKYQFSTEAKRKYWRDKKAEQRKQLKEQYPAKKPGSPREQRLIGQLERGEITQEQFDAAAAEGL